MSGTLFIITVPQMKYEETLKKEKPSVIVIDKDFMPNDDKTKRKTSTDWYAKIDLENLSASKCKSTEFLNSTCNVPPIVKASSENALNDKDSSSYFKVSWEDMKQALKPKKSKLKISRSGGIDLLSAFHWDTPLETILSEILLRVNVNNSSWNNTNGDKFWQVTFTMESGNLSEELLQVLKTFGIGSKFKSSVCMLPCALFYKSQITGTDMAESKECMKESAWNRFSSSVRARHNLAQILQGVRSEAALTFDWLFLLIVAAFVAAIGLVENSTVVLVASMLISPLMSPITASTLGTAVKDRSLQLMGVAHELFGLFLALVIGFIFGLVICAVDEHYGVGDWPTNEILSRCEIRSLWVGVLIAIPSGAAVALAILGEYTSSLVGVAISASLLPPAVNAGLLWAMSLVHLVYNDDETQWNGVITKPVYSNDQPTELAILGLISLCLTLVNIISIFLAGVAVYKVKEVCPLERKNMSWWRNENRNHDNSQQYKNFDNWNTYRRWYTSTTSRAERIANKYSIQNDTVTYRKPSKHHEILKAQEIETYCEGKENLDENDSQESNTETSGDDQNHYETSSTVEENICNKKTETDQGDDLNNLEKIAQIMRIRGHTRNSLETTKTVSKDYKSMYDNFGFQSLDHIRNLSQEENLPFPTIEPSSNVTVNENGVVLDSNSYHV